MNNSKINKYILAIIIIFPFNLFANEINLFCNGIEMKVIKFNKNNVIENIENNFNSINLALNKDQKILTYLDKQYKVIVNGNTYKFSYFEPNYNLENQIYMLNLNLNLLDGSFNISKNKNLSGNKYVINELYSCKKV